jgi:hypothetical protein
LMPAAPLLVMIASYAAQALAITLGIWWVVDRISGLVRKRTAA